MQSIASLRASNGAANASVVTVQVLRSPGATTIQGNTVANLPPFFIATMGAPHTFTDPVTGETITIISEATAVDFAGHVDGSNLIIDTIAPGYADTRGSLVGDIVVIKPTTFWSDTLANVLSQAHNDNGSIKNDSITTQDQFVDALDPVLRGDETIEDLVASGGVWAITSGLSAGMTALIAYQAGHRGSVAAIAARAFTVSKDTYVDVLRNTTTQAFSIVYTEVTNGAVAPALAANSIRLAKVVTSEAAITGIQQYGVDNAASVNQILPLLGMLSQLKGMTNTGTAGGTAYYGRIGNLKFYVGNGNSKSTSSSPTLYGWALPAGFFNQILTVQHSIMSVTLRADQYVAGDSFSLTSVNAYFTSPGGAATIVPGVIVIGF